MKMKKAALLIFIMLLALPGWSEIIAREGKGYLEMVNGQLILHLKGSYYELGYQHGKLLQDMVRKNISRIVDNQEEIGKSQIHHTRCCAEEECMNGCCPCSGKIQENARSGGWCRGDAEDVIVGNLFPEAFHCSGIALMNRATMTAHSITMRLLDYMTGAGLQSPRYVIVERKARMPS